MCSKTIIAKKKPILCKVLNIQVLKMKFIPISENPYKVKPNINLEKIISSIVLFEKND